MPASALLAAISVASLNLCTDEYLLLLAAPQQIVSVTHLSHQPAETPLWRQARRYPRNDGSLASIAGRRPQLVLTMGGGARDRLRIAERLGMRVIDLPYPQSLADIEAAVRRIGTALGRQAQAAAILRKMRLLRRSAPATQADAIWLGGGGRTLASDGLGAQWMSLAGLRQRSGLSDHVSLEQLLVTPPKVLLKSAYRSGQYSSEQRWLAHPLARRARAGVSLTTDGRVWTCMGPLMVPEIERLRKELAG